MKTLPIAATILVFLSGAPLYAQVVTFETLDADGNGAVSFDEALVAYPNMSEEIFNAVDIDGSGVIDPTEMAAADPSLLSAAM